MALAVFLGLLLLGQPAAPAARAAGAEPPADVCLTNSCAGELRGVTPSPPNQAVANAITAGDPFSALEAGGSPQDIAAAFVAAMSVDAPLTRNPFSNPQVIYEGGAPVLVERDPAGGLRTRLPILPRRP